MTANDNAFDATVTSIEVGAFDNNAGAAPATVSFAVHEVFAGPPRTTVQMKTWDSFLPQDPETVVGARVLAAAGSTLDVKACGYTRPYSDADAADWRRSFGG